MNQKNKNQKNACICVHVIEIDLPHIRVLLIKKTFLINALPVIEKLTLIYSHVKAGYSYIQETLSKQSRKFKYQTSPDPDQMMSPERSYSSSSLDIVELTSSLQDTKPCRASLHQRSASDSLAFVNKPYLVGPGSCQSSNIGAEWCSKLDGGNADGKAIDHNVEKLEDSSSSSLIGESTPPPTEPQKRRRNFHPSMDPKNIKRPLVNRVSAQKSRLRKLEYIEKFKRDINTEQARVSFLAPQNNAMKQRMEFLEKDMAKKDAEYQALKDERDMLALTYFLMQEGI
ncbi:basic leucine zipper 6-like [Durio zibethinus]|uniref:Basic leucine zipper 6-like n=1 Tax=Durio zibethinus TaxID=66656 RepID=A0A6P6ALX1_DURZI|nr:basic leucine zipper 6-like [Durio zibethinus]